MSDSMKDGFYQAYSGTHKEGASRGFFRVGVSPTKRGVLFVIFQGTDDSLQIQNQFFSKKIGTNAALKDFRQRGPIQFDWMRTVPEKEYLKKKRIPFP